mmetsp:Transcript_7643/g.18884  ORF Transcript_7643/g.18884 Transcript_7643/m.18884 type:complete len:547 (+) Transcript_7643:96-1736(+)
MTMRRTTTTTRAYHHHLLYHSSDLHRIEQQQCYKRGAPSLALFLLTMMIIIIDAVVVDVDAFGISSGSINDNSNSPPRWRLNSFRIQNIGATTTSDRGNTNTVLSAVMYGTDGKKISDDLSNDHDDDKPNEPSIIPDRRFDSRLVEKLNTKTSVSSILKVVACAFAEPPHDTILPKDVVVATLVEVSQTRMDIALGVKTFDENRGGGSSSADGQQSLVQILINVPLTTPCPPNKSTNGDNDDIDIDRDVATECVAKTLIQLEPYSVARIERREWRQQQQQDDDYVEDEEEWPPKVVTDVIETTSKESPSVTVSSGESKSVSTYYEDSKPDSNYRYPDWWIFPSPLEKTLSNECDSMKSLLNEGDFATDRIQLSRQGQEYSNTEGTGDVVIQKSFVSIVGPAGVVLRTQQSNKDEELNVVEELVPVRFVSGATAKSPETLRDLVLELVESLEDAEQQKQQEEQKGEQLVQDAEPIVESTVTPPAPVSAPAPSSVSNTKDSVELSKDVIEARRQPKSPAEESKLAAKYASIEDIGDRAFAILKDLHMI